MFGAGVSGFVFGFCAVGILAAAVFVATGRPDRALAILAFVGVALYVGRNKGDE